MSILFPNQVQSTYLQNGLSADIAEYKTPIGKGIVYQHNYTYNVVPAQLDVNNVAGNDTGSAGTQVPYERTIVLPETNVPTIVYGVVLRSNTVRVLTNPSDKYIAMDCLRVPIVVFSAPTTAPTDVYIFGLDNNFKFLIDKITVAAGTNGNVYFNKSFLLIKDVIFTSVPGVPISVGRGNKFGLPHLVTDLNYIHSLKWNNAALNTNTFTAGLIWRSTTTNPQTKTPNVSSSDSHGLIDLSAQGQLPDFIRLLTVHYYVYGTDAELNAQVQNAANPDPNNGFYNTSAVQQVSLQLNASGSNYAMPYLVEQDMTGAQYPGDEVFMSKYRLALAQ